MLMGSCLNTTLNSDVGTVLNIHVNAKSRPKSKHKHKQEKKKLNTNLNLNLNRILNTRLIFIPKRKLEHQTKPKPGHNAKHQL